MFSNFESLLRLQFSPTLSVKKSYDRHMITASNMVTGLLSVFHNYSWNFANNQIKINFIGIKSRLRTVTSHMYTVTQEQSQT